MKTVESTAYHEASHSVVFERLGFGVRSVSLHGNGKNAGLTRPRIVPVRDRTLLRTYLIGVLAGPLASGRTIRWKDGHVASSEADSGDAAVCAAVAGRLAMREEDWHMAVALTRTLLDRADVRRQIAAVQRALLGRGSLDGDEVEDLVREAGIIYGDGGSVAAPARAGLPLRTPAPRGPPPDRWRPEPP